MSWKTCVSSISNRRSTRHCVSSWRNGTRIGSSTLMKSSRAREEWPCRRTDWLGRSHGRPKHLYGIYQKMNKQSITFEEVYDLTALRIVTDTKMNCYAVLGVIHSALAALCPGASRTTSRFPSPISISLCIPRWWVRRGNMSNSRSARRRCIASPSTALPRIGSIKNKGTSRDRDSKAFGWLHQFVEWHEDLPDNRQFMDSVKLDLFHDVVYVFTPKGIVKELPKGSTPVDFAFRDSHGGRGPLCRGQGGRQDRAAQAYQLASGDTVEILTSPTQSPHKDWLKFVRTSRAKTKIKHWIKLEEQKRSIEIGRRLLESEFRRQGMAPARMFKSAELLDVARQSGFDSTDELAAAVGFGRVATSQVIE